MSQEDIINHLEKKIKRFEEKISLIKQIIIEDKHHNKPNMIYDVERRYHEKLKLVKEILEEDHLFKNDLLKPKLTIQGLEEIK